MTVGKFTRPGDTFYNRKKKRIKLVAMELAEQKVNESSSDTIVCPECETELPGHARFCRVCGEPIKSKDNQKEVDETSSLPLDAGLSNTGINEPAKENDETSSLPSGSHALASNGNASPSEEEEEDTIVQDKEVTQDETSSLPLDSHALASNGNASPSAEEDTIVQDKEVTQDATTPEEVDLPDTPLPEIDSQAKDTHRSSDDLRKRIFRRRSSSPEDSGSSPQSWGLLPLFSVICAIGVFLVALAYEGGRLSEPWAGTLFWIGLLLVYLPVAVRLFLSKPTRRERIALLVLLTISLYLVYYFQYPLYFTGYDDFSHWRGALDLVASGHLFQANPLLPISPYYPGMEIFTTALSSLTGLSLFASGTLLIGVAHLIFALAIYLFFEHFTDSPRMAGIAALLYMANPGYLFFDMNFAYESLALPLALFVLFAVVQRNKAPKGKRLGLNVVILLGLGAVVVTHHLTSFFLVAFLLLWAAIPFILRLVGRIRRNHPQKEPVGSGPGWIALAGLLILFAWLAYTRGQAIDYLFPHLQSTLQQFTQILANKGTPRQLFHNTSGFVEPFWERLISIASVALILIGLPLGLFKIWRSHRANVGILALAIAALAYPVSQALRLTAAGAESGSRATEFVFLGVAFVLAIFVVAFWSSSKPSWKRSTLILGAVSIIIFGQLALGGGQPWSLLPGPYLVSADSRSIEPEGITAAQWANVYLPGQRVTSDRINTLLMATYGREQVVTSASANAAVSHIFTSLNFGSGVISIIRVDGIQYLVVDHRLSTSLPYSGTYFNLTGSSSQSAQQIQSGALTKFDSEQNVSRIFDSGDIVIYNVGAILHPPPVILPTYCKPTPSTGVSSSITANIAINYAGKLYDLTDGATADITFTGFQQLQGGICGSLGGLPTKTHATGMPSNGSFKGNITPTGQIQFTVTTGSGHPSFTFSGVILSDGNMQGSYCEMAQGTGSCSNYGLWSVSPQNPNKGSG